MVILLPIGKLQQQPNSPYKSNLTVGNLMNYLQDIVDLTVAITEKVSLQNEQNNQSIDEFNTVFDETVELKTKLSAAEDMLTKQSDHTAKMIAIVEASKIRANVEGATIISLRAQLSALLALDPKRLSKINKRYKEDNASLKTANKALNAKNTVLKADINKLSKELSSKGNIPFYTCPTSGNTLTTVAGVRVPMKKESNGVPGSPVLEYFNMEKGISRRGYLGQDDCLLWASAKNTLPSKEESMIAREFIHLFCKQAKIKIKIKKTD